MPAISPATPSTFGVPPSRKYGKLGRLRLAGRVAAGAALAPGRSDARGPTYKRPGAGRPEQRLVAGEGEQVDVHRLHVDRHDAGRLGRVHEEQQVVLAGDPADLGDRLHGAEDVAGVRHGDRAASSA